MRPLRPVLLAVAAAGLAACSDQGPVASAPASAEPAPLLSAAPGRAVEGSYIVVLNEGAGPRSVAAAAGVEPAFVYGAALNGFAAELNGGQLAALQRDPRVRYVEENQTVAATAVPWGLDRIDQHNLPLDGIYSVNTLAPGVSVYVIDTGIQTAHPAFGGRAANVYDALGGTGQDCNGHGTAVAGVVGSSTHGVARGVKLRGVRVLSCAGSGTTAQSIAGIDWVRVNGVRPAVANISLGGSVSSALNTAVTNLVNAGVFTAVAVGNGGTSACNTSPASAAGAYGVGASTPTDNVMSGTNYGSCLDIYAPGSSIPTTWLNGGTTTLSGSSMATPHVAGVAALYLAYNPTASSTTVANWITSNATVGVLIGVPPGTANRLLYKATL
ncbi:MAG TPA: S8 family peptidase [Longimicrobiaceae bacterium]|jgi:subtilisin family serine protease